MPTTQWIPSELIDERQPTLRDTRSDWIVTGEDGEPALSDGDDGIVKSLGDNDVVNFCSCTIFGTGVLELKSPDQWTVDHGMPREASKVCATNIFDIDTGANSLNEFVEGIIEQRTERGEEELIPDGTRFPITRTPMTCRIALIEPKDRSHWLPHPIADRALDDRVAEPAYNPALR